MKTLVITVLFALAAYGQTPVRDTPLGCAPNAACVTLNDYTSTTLIYTANAPQFLQPSGNCQSAGRSVGSTCIKRSDSTLTSIVVLTNTATVTCATACGAWVGMRVKVYGATVDTDLNGDYTVLTTPTSTTYTLTTASVANATYTESTLTVSTVNPLTTSPIWGLTALKYDGSSNLVTVDYYGNVAWSARTTY